MSLKPFYFKKYIFIFFLSIQSLPTLAEIYAHQVSGGITVFSNVDTKYAGDTTTNGNNKLHHQENQAEKTVVKNSEFPRIAKELQQERNLRRISILNAELDAEQKAFHSATEQRAMPDILRRHIVNIAALKREISTSR
jgi:hypothetical protein